MYDIICSWNSFLKFQWEIVAFNIMLGHTTSSKKEAYFEHIRTGHRKEVILFFSVVRVILIIKSRRMRWAGHVTRTG
jgi:hypothetical protein